MRLRFWRRPKPDHSKTDSGERPSVKLVVGLGNPGRKYQASRHNVGFAVLAELARKFGTSRPKAKFRGEVVEADFDGQKALLLSPVTYMNRSGASVQLARDFYKISERDLLVICDDLNLPLAKLRFRTGGSAGGQKGLADVIRSLGTDQVPRLRIGIGSPPEGWDGTDYVLGRFTKTELPEIEDAVARAADAVAVWAREGIRQCMNQYN
ncbi:MAG: aminoacyl-tRNA hydrolase [Planctomycetota bacterium]|jgi:PTH1 family peptidyl-tRNA hydrolase